MIFVMRCLVAIWKLALFRRFNARPTAANSSIVNVNSMFHDWLAIYILILRRVASTGLENISSIIVGFGADFICLHTRAASRGDKSRRTTVRAHATCLHRPLPRARRWRIRHQRLSRYRDVRASHQNQTRDMIVERSRPARPVDTAARRRRRLCAPPRKRPAARQRQLQLLDTTDHQPWMLDQKAPGKDETKCKAIHGLLKTRLVAGEVAIPSDSPSGEGRSTG